MEKHIAITENSHVIVLAEKTTAGSGEVVLGKTVTCSLQHARASLFPENSLLVAMAVIGMRNLLGYTGLTPFAFLFPLFYL